MSSPKAGALYFTFAFAAGWVFGPIRELWVIPHFGKTAGYLFEVPLMLVVIIAAARWTVRRLAVPQTFKARSVMGLWALALLLVAELVGTRWVRGLSLADYLASFRSVPGAISLLMFLLFAAMPILVGRSPSGG